MTIRILGNRRDGVGESPFWSAQDGKIWSVDITGRCIVERVLETGETVVHPTDDLPTALALDGRGGAMVSFAGGVAVGRTTRPARW